MGIEPISQAWQACALADELTDHQEICRTNQHPQPIRIVPESNRRLLKLVAGVGIEPTYAAYEAAE